MASLPNNPGGPRKNRENLARKNGEEEMSLEPRGGKNLAGGKPREENGEEKMSLEPREGGNLVVKMAK